MQEYTHDDIYQIKEEDIIEIPNDNVVKRRKESKTKKYVGYAFVFTFILSLIIGIFIGSKRK
jgi:cytochrome b